MTSKNIHQRNTSGNNIVVSGNGNIVAGGNLHTQRIQSTESSDDTNILQENITGDNIVVNGDKPTNTIQDEVKAGIAGAIANGWLEEIEPGKYRLTPAGDAHIESLRKSDTGKKD